MKRRIVVLGSSGTGKTTLCRKLGNKFNIKELHLDSVYWKEDWDHLDKEEFDAYMRNFLGNNDSWVIDGNYSNNKHFKYRLDLATTIIFLDFGVQASLKGIHERAGKYKHQTRSDMADGCIEGIDQIFLQYVAFYDKRAKKLIATINKYKNRKEILIFKNREELYDWYNSL